MNNYHNVRPFYQCEIAVDDPKLSLLRMMGAGGRISADHFSIKDDRVVTILNEDEIDMLLAMGFKIKKGENMLEQTERVKNEVTELAPLVESDGTVSGFVNKYLDTQGILNKFQSLHNEFSHLMQIIELPYKTSGYDGSKIDLGGTSTVKLFRINTDPKRLKQECY